jgi:hypothetical protein
MDILFSNNAKTLLDVLLAIDGLSATVDSAADFPSPTGSQYFYATIQNPADDTDYEIVKCTAVTGAVVTIERAQEGTLAQEWAVGSLFELRLTAGGIDDINAHQADHLSGGATEIDGDKVDIDWNPTYYTPGTSPGEVTSVDHLSAHLHGIDQRIAPASQSARGTIELATHDEAKTGSDTGRAVSPSALTAVLKQQSWMQEDGYYIGTDKVRARDGDGLDLEDDGGNGIHIADGGAVTIDNGLAAYSTLIVHRGSEAVADESEITLATGVSGWGFAQAGDNEEWIQFTFTAAGVVSVVANSANAINSDTDANLCVYDAGSGIAIKNRLGASKTIRYVVHYSS